VFRSELEHFRCEACFSWWCLLVRVRLELSGQLDGSFAAPSCGGFLVAYESERDWRCQWTMWLIKDQMCSTGRSMQLTLFSIRPQTNPANRLISCSEWYAFISSVASLPTK
jgi:hypothetical protein